jgi:hypothetical protein
LFRDGLKIGLTYEVNGLFDELDSSGSGQDLETARVKMVGEKNISEAATWMTEKHGRKH